MVRRWWWSRNGFQQGTDLNLVLSLARPLFLASPSATYTFDTIMPTRHAVLSLVLAAVTLVLAACATRPVLEPAGVSVIRTYRFSTNVPDPQPAWNPKSHVIVARSLGGFSVLQEGQGRQELFESTESRQTWYPQWLNRNQFVFGPMRNVSPVTDGRVVPATDGLTVVTLEDTGLRYNVRREALSAVGYRPRVADGLIYAQVESKQVVIDTQGKVSDAGEGFFAEPQAGGQGIAWQETPIYEPDRWTSHPARGQLFIRWSPGVVTVVPGGCQPRWTAAGGLVCTVLRGEPAAEGPWWKGGTDVWHISGRDAAPVLVARNARSAAPHPQEPLIAVSDATAGVRLVSLREPQAAEQLLTATGSHPLWSHDGLRILSIEQSEDRPATIVVSVLIAKPTLP